MSFNASILRELPEFLIDSIAYCDVLTYKRGVKSCLILTKDLKFHEFRCKQLLHSVDLSNTCFASLAERIKLYNGRKSKLLGENLHNNQCDTRPSTTKDALKVSTAAAIVFGKYNYRNFEINKLYLLIHCWNKLIVLQHSSHGTVSGDFQIIAQHYKVSGFKMIPSHTMKYQAMVKILFENGSFICTDFQENVSTSTSDASVQQCERNEFKRLLERVRTSKAELQLHKEITQNYFESLRNTQTFGNLCVRSLHCIEEKPLLARCGDVWMRVTSQDYLVVGLPLINNHASPNLTTLQNVKPILILGTSETTTIPTGGLSYEHRIYQLQQSFEDFETLETFFKTEEDIEFQPDTWSSIDNDAGENIPPLAFVVVLLKFKLSQLTLIKCACQVFVRFEIEKDLELAEPKTTVFEQHLWLKTLDFERILQQRLKLEVNFCETTLHQDFLAIAVTSCLTKLKIIFNGHKDLKRFQQLLTHKFDFRLIQRETLNTNMITDEPVFIAKHFSNALYYNQKPSSTWFGSLVTQAKITELQQENSLTTFWAFYTKNEEKTFLMIKLLLSELISFKCNIVDIDFDCQQKNPELKIPILENAIRQELNAALDFSKSANDKEKKFKHLMKLQLQTDLAAESI